MYILNDGIIHVTHTCPEILFPSDLHYKRDMICAKKVRKSLCKSWCHRWTLSSFPERGHVNEPGTVWWGVPRMQTTFPTMQLSHCLVSPFVLPCFTPLWILVFSGGVAVPVTYRPDASVQTLMCFWHRMTATYDTFLSSDRLMGWPQRVLWARKQV